MILILQQLFRLIFFVDLVVLAIQPRPRIGAGCAYLQHKIYCFGGSRYAYADSHTTTISSHSLFSLDISGPVTASDSYSAWVKAIPNSSLKPDRVTMFGLVALPKHDVVIVTGGASTISTMDMSVSNPTIAFDIKTNEWRVLNSDFGSQAYGSATVSGHGNEIYVFGGVGDIHTNNQSLADIREMRIFDYNLNQWRMMHLPDKFSSYLWHTATMGRDGHTIYYLGGELRGMFMAENGTQVYGAISNRMENVMSYNTKVGNWILRHATGASIPSPRMWHSAVLKPNTDDIVLYGGATVYGDVEVVNDFCYVLDTISMHWTRINLSMSVGPGPRYGHSAVFPDNSTKMFIIFGADNNHYPHSDFRVLDTVSWEWVDYYEGSKHNEPSRFSMAAVAGIIAAVTTGVTILFGILMLIRRQRLHQKRANLSADNGTNHTDITSEARLNLATRANTGGIPQQPMRTPP